MVMFDFESSISGLTEVAFAWFGVGGGEESSDPSVVVHALDTPFVFSLLPLDSFVKLVIWLLLLAIRALHLFFFNS